MAVEYKCGGNYLSRWSRKILSALLAFIVFFLVLGIIAGILNMLGYPAFNNVFSRIMGVLFFCVFIGFTYIHAFLEKLGILNFLDIYMVGTITILFIISFFWKLLFKGYWKLILRPYMVVMTIVGFSLFVFIIISLASMWGIEKKIRNKGWISLIPLYNIGCLSKDILGSFWLFLLLFIPGVNIIYLFTLLYNIGKSFGKSNSYCILMMFLPSVLLPLLAFDNSSYKKNEKKDTKTNNKSVHNKTTIIKKEEQVTSPKNTSDIIKWIITIIILLLSVTILVSYFEETKIGYLSLAFMFLVYALLLCPSITRYTKKYKRYTKFKPLLIILLLIFNFILLTILPF